MRVETEELVVGLLKGPARTAPSLWTRSYVRILLAGDMACSVVACETVLGVRLWFGAFIPETEALLGLSLALIWPLALASGGAYRKRTHGEGTDEFRAVFNGAAGLTAAVAIGAYVTQTPIARSFVMAMFPLAFA